MASTVETISSNPPSSPHEKPHTLSGKIYDASTIDLLPWDEFEEGKKAKGILLPLIKESSESYLSNVKTTVFVYTCGTHLFPLTLNESEYHNSYIASNYYLVPMLGEWARKIHPLVSMAIKPLQAILSLLLKGMSINQFILINNWLFAVSPSIHLSKEEIQELVTLLQGRFPKHTIMWRGLETFQGQKMISVLKELKFRLIKTRSVFFYDPQRKAEHSSKVQYHHRRDLRLIDKEGYVVVRNKDLKISDLRIFLDLYFKVYMEKHTSYSPAFTLSFLENALKNDLLHFVALKKGEKIDGVFAYFTRGGMMTCPFFGYDTSMPKASSLYRMLTVLLYKESEERNLPLNDSSGGAATKKYRGLKLYLEYSAILDSHLPLRKRLFWASADFAMNLVITPYLNWKEKKRSHKSFSKAPEE